MNSRELFTEKSQIAPWVNCYPAGSMIAPHFHNELQILYASSGSMHVRTQGQVCVVNPARAAIIPPGLEHEICISGQTAMASLYVGDLQNAPHLDAVRSITVSPMMKQLLLTTIVRSASPTFNPTHNIHLLGLLFEEMHNKDLRVPSISIPQDRRAALVCEKVLADPTEHPSLEALADQVGASSRTISRIFRRELGLTFSDWRQQVQINFAINALHQGLPITKIADELGYSSASAFSFAFRKHVGYSPSAYAKLTTSIHR
ncbi:AraC family transcriptional regulator [Nitrincola sp. A-D6]|uniref:AraC family transcriptional regulator n=1 Tax=Nitrincola sp. A-D6 TaxID=1545442 RepID=UPI00068DEA0F|nr:helix-turn-helix transcriptional regulator [Nitrincola sp. A-D6]